MKTLTKITLSFALVLASVAVYGQSINFKAGTTFSNIILNEEGSDMTNKYKPGLALGLTADFPLTSVLELETGLNFNQKGFRVDEAEDGWGFEAQIAMNYIDIPVSLKFNNQLGDLNLFFAAGGYLGIGINAVSKYKETYLGESYSDTETIAFGSEDEVFERFEGGARLSAGAEYKSLLIEFSFARGMSDIVYGNEDEAIAFNQYFGLSVGYIMDII